MNPGAYGVGRPFCPDVPSNATVTPVARSASVQNFLLPNAARQGFFVHNDSGGVLYIKYGSGATTSDFTVRIPANTTFEPFIQYNGLITGIWGAGGAGNALITELFK